MRHSTTSQLTKAHMGRALLELMAQKPINKITVKELSERAQINRQTFYYHFTDMYSLLEWLLKQTLNSILVNIESFKTWQDAGIYLLNYLNENSDLVSATLNSMSRNTLKTLLYDEIHMIANRFVKELAFDIKASDEAFEKVTHYCCITFTALLEDWFTSDAKNTSPEELIYHLDLIVRGLVRNALTRYAIREAAL